MVHHNYYYFLSTQSGPMAEGITPREASDRLNQFQTQFDELWRRFQTYSEGEKLFGLSSTPYPELDRIRKELNLLQKLYGLYNIVMDSVDGYYDILWTEASVKLWMYARERERERERERGKICTV